MPSPRHRILVVIVLVSALLLPALAGAGNARVLADRAAQLEVYRLPTDRAGIQLLVVGGADLVGVRQTGLDRFDVQLVAARPELIRLREQGFEPRLWLTPDGRTATESLAFDQDRVQQTGGVYRPWDGPGNIDAEIRKLAADHPDRVELKTIGKTIQGRDILALRVTAGIAQAPSRPKVLYNALQHAREWIAIETNRRLAHHFIEGYGQDAEVTAILDKTELWFVICANPDGYQLTFQQGFRLWRKNARDLNGDGAVDANNDGVDINRNFAARWNFDTEGSSGTPNSQTYRGPSAASEPETVALQDLVRAQKFALMLNYHSAAELILYPDGWQDQTRTADDPIFTALAGTLADPAVPGFTPMLSAGLYITNGETCDYAHAQAGTLCFTPELSTPPPGSGGGTFEFPDNEALIQAEFQKNLPFALDIARTAQEPEAPSSHLAGRSAAAIQVDAFGASYGSPQPVQANVQRRLGPVTMRYRVNGGTVQEQAAADWAGGERYGDTGDVYYHRVRAAVPGGKPGDKVEVTFSAGGVDSQPFTYTVEHVSKAPVLVVSAEDYSGTNPDYAKTDGPSYLEAYTEALRQIDLAYDVYDVDAHGRQAPSQLGVLSHYRAVIWYTGDDVAPLAKGQTAGTVDRGALDLMLAVRGYLNEGGKLLYTGKSAGRPYLQSLSYAAEEGGTCNPMTGGGCEPLSDDFMQYYLGVWSGQAVDGIDGGRVEAADSILGAIDLNLAKSTSGASDKGMSYRLTTEVMNAQDYPMFDTSAAGAFRNIGVKARSGDHFLSAGSTTYDWQRLTRTVDLSAAQSGSLTFWINRQMRPQFDAFFVEAHTVGQDDWTTLPDGNGHSSGDDALTCASAAWNDIFPHLPHYMTRVSDQDCQPKGTTGDWHAATGASNGWEEWKVDLSAYKGKQVELSLTYIRSRLAFPGAYVDDLAVMVDGATTSLADFEADLGGWTAAGLPVMVQGAEQPHEVDWSRKTIADLPPVAGSPIAVREDAVTLGFGLESVADLKARSGFLKRVLMHLVPDLYDVVGPTPTPPPSGRPLIYLPLVLDKERLGG